MIVDSHHHFWDPAGGEYPWMTEAFAAIRRRFGPAELQATVDERVQATIVVEARESISETASLLAQAGESDLVTGVVGWVDLTDPGIGQTLGDLRRGKLVGIRHHVHDEADPGWLRRDDVQRGIAEVGRAGLTYDFLIRPRELAAALETATNHPGMRFVIDHLAKPRVQAGREDVQWAAAMEPFSELGHVFCKVSGLVTEADWTQWTVADLAPYVRAALRWFGDDRIMLGSDWPVCLVAGSYQAVLDAYVAALGELPAEAIERISRLNALRCYGLA
jgi:L-fuconolactonase